MIGDDDLTLKPQQGHVGSLRILLIEAAGHADLVRALAREGHDVLTIGADARPTRFIGVFRPDVILSATPDVIRVCRELRRVDRETPIIALLGGDTVDDRVRALNAGADDCVSLLVTRAELVARVHAVARRAVTADRHGGSRPVGDPDNADAR